MKIIVLGASGQLGSCIKKVSAQKNTHDILFATQQNGNILDEELLGKLFEKEKPSFVINCAAYTAVDKAEDEQELCRKINRDGALTIAKACKQHNASLIHISTDFVFKGNVAYPLQETDSTAPENVYGITKLEGETAIAALLPEHFIIRTSWLYSEFGNNFVKTMLRIGKDRRELGIIADQIGSPTYAIDLANTILDIIEAESNSYGIYHYSNEGVASWFDFAKAVFDISNTHLQLNPLKTSEYVTKAVRPAYSVMDKSKIKNTFGIQIPYWRDSLARCMEQLAVTA
jgi:dTDP-4-dehydrorhamnose reductase